MKASRLAIGTLAYSVANLALAQAVPLGVAGVPLPILEGGLLTVAVVGLVAGIRIVRRKQNR